MSVLISAPLSIFLVAILGPRSLEKESDEEREREKSTPSYSTYQSKIISKFEIKAALEKIERYQSGFIDFDDNL